MYPVQRANEHVKQVDAEVAAFFEAQPYLVYAKYDFDAPEHTIRVRALAQPSSHVALVAADALQNLRSALDHLIYQLANLDPNVPRGERTQFPIYETVERFDAMPKTYLEGVPGRYWADLYGCQPFNPDFALLWPLLVLNDRDKHRVLESFVASAANVTITAPADIASTFRQVTWLTDKFDLDDDAVMGTFRSDRQVPMQFQATWTIGFGLKEGPRINPAQLRILVSRVAQILAHFRVAFDPPDHDPAPAGAAPTMGGSSSPPPDSDSPEPPPDSSEAPASELEHPSG